MVSVIVPLFNEEKNLILLFEKYILFFLNNFGIMK